MVTMTNNPSNDYLLGYVLIDDLYIPSTQIKIFTMEIINLGGAIKATLNRYVK